MSSKKRWALTLTLALMASSFLPSSLTFAEEVSTEPAEVIDEETLVEPEVNEDSLKYLLLVDSFETAERIPTKRLATPADVVVVTADEINANHYQSVEEALSHANGMVMNFINGSDRVLTLVNGRRTFMNPPMKAIERIEVVKGGGSALYGSDAVGGVINIITKRGDHDETTFDVNTGSWHRHRYEITNQGNDGKLGWFIDAGIGKSRPYNSRGADNHSGDYDEKYASIRLDHRFDDNNSLVFDVMHYSNHSNKYRTDRNMSYFPSNYTPKHEIDNQISLTYNFKEESSTPGFLRYFNNYSNVDNVLYGKGKSRLQGVDYQNGWELGQHKLIVGVEWHQSSDEHERWDYAQKKINNTAYYIQDTITMGRKWTLVPGTRLDHNSNFGSQWSPKIAANYSPDDQTKFYASWGRVYQAPNARQLYTHMTRWMSIGGIPYRYENWNGSSNLQPETGHTETIGVEHDFSDKANISLSLFNASITGYLDLNDSGSRYGVDPYVAQLLNLNYVNSSEDEQRGINLMYRQKMDDHWSYNLGYAYTHRDRPLGSEEYLNHWRVPRNSYKATLRYQNGPWKASLHGIMGTGAGGTNYMEDDFALLDFNISCEVSDWATIYAKAINFTNQNRSYYGRGSNAPGRLFQFGLDCYF
ncbi:MAG: TonB-dependent receptor [Selenomonadaceae bacterium]|nr:TonB-dependent receptor [Selenomonadaceae bacterium]